MRILQVDLESVKSYEQARVQFTPGTNAICGHNGAGKSTLLEAIGFALFNYLAVSQDDFVREGEKLATVTVHLEDRDGRGYQVIRKCGSYSQHYIFDPELDQKLTDGHRETMAWLNEFMGMDGTEDLSVLFRDAVGVPQGLLTAAFLETPSRRKDIFNPLLRVDEYERAWEGLREPARRLDRLIAEQATRIARLETQVEALPDLRERAATLSADIQVGEGQASVLEETREEIAADLGVLSERKERLDALESEVRRAEALVQTTRTRLEVARAALQASEAAQEVVEASRTGHEAYTAAQVDLAGLEDEREVRDALVSDREKVGRQLAAVEERARSLSAELDACAEAAVAMARLEPDVARQTELENKLQTAQRDADRLEAARQDLAREQSRLAELEQRHAVAESESERRKEREAALIDEREELAQWTEKREALASEAADLRTQLAEIDARIDAAERRVADLEARVEEAQKRATQLETRLSEVRVQLDELKEVESAISGCRDALREETAQRRALLEESAACEAELTQVQRQIEMLSTTQEPKCPVCGEPLTPEHREELLSDNRSRVVNLAASRESAQEALDAVEEAVEKREAELARLEDRARALPRPAEADALTDQIGEQDAALGEIRKALAEARADLVRRRDEADDLAPDLQALEADLAAAVAACETRQATVRALESEIQALPRPDEVAALAQDIERGSAALSETEGRVRSLEAAPSEVKRLTSALEELGNPRRAYDRAADRAAKAPEISRRHADTLAEIEGLEAELTELRETLADFDNLDARIATVRDALVEHESDHQRFLQHEREAAALPEHRTEVDGLAVALKEAETAYSEEAEARDEVAEAYDAELHAELTDELTEIRAELAELTERLRHQRAQLTEAQDEIVTLEAVQVELEDAQAESADLQATQALLIHLRQVLRDAGPEVTRALVRMISLHADQLYADIMQNYGVRLRWTEDYDIVLRTEGRERTFQQLSGGEQMAAALAVRLALLRETSTIDVAFFDEPTANLDSERRSNLARQILNVKGFSQLFVISHDDTFETDTDHVVRVHKENGATVVEA